MVILFPNDYQLPRLKTMPSARDIRAKNERVRTVLLIGGVRRAESFC